ncbi:MAG TPA: WYL domain-containing protein, partial [Acidimicrobiales bacterium]|nr:WYL domain-containing protein [Acidimicrobiales bacterium]
RWYLVAHDLDRADWRTYRVDRIGSAVRTGHRFVPVELADPVALAGEAITTAPYRWRATVAVAAPVAELARRVPPTVGVVRPDADGSGSMLIVGADDLDVLAGHLVGLGLGFEVLEPPELRELLGRVGAALARAHGGPGPSGAPPTTGPPG